MGKFVKGHGRVGGRKKGSVNKTTRIYNTVRESVLATYQELQSDPNHNLMAFAKKHPRDFYQIASKLIPTEITGANGQSLQTIINVIHADHQSEDKPVNG